MKHDRFDVVVIGGGHAGCEAAHAAARRGARVAIVTFDPGVIGAMSCNPAIGGVGKGHLVREVDAFGGLIAKAADSAAIHYRMLNRSRGRAVWGPRIQADRTLFSTAIQQAIEAHPAISLIRGEAARLDPLGLGLADGTLIEGRAIVVASGTFLRGRLFQGRQVQSGGRTGEASSHELADQLRELSPSIRLKTGTPPRLDGRTIDWAALSRQESDSEPWTIAPFAGRRANPQLFCAITRTNDRTHDVIRQTHDLSPLYSGDIEGSGPRYCPSIEDKVRRFGDRDGHQVFLEPEGLATSLVYPNGISTSLPADVQEQFVRTMAGCEKAVVAKPGYAVEYDCLDPRRLDATLGHRDRPGLFLAGQVNGTTGYEEAAAQGLVAGMSAAAFALDLDPVTLDRRESYTGVMIDDLTLQGVTEPYRMLTARAERRLHLRSDNAEARLFDAIEAAGTLSASELAAAKARMADRASGRSTDPELQAEIAETNHYRPYVEREIRQAEKLERIDRSIPADFDYSSVSGLSSEMRERLDAVRPVRLDQAKRIPGITPAAVTAILASLSIAA